MPWHRLVLAHVPLPQASAPQQWPLAQGDCAGQAQPSAANEALCSDEPMEPSAYGNPGLETLPPGLVTRAVHRLAPPAPQSPES